MNSLCNSGLSQRSQLSQILLLQCLQRVHRRQLYCMTVLHPQVLSSDIFQAILKIAVFEGNTVAGRDSAVLLPNPSFVPFKYHIQDRTAQCLDPLRHAAEQEIKIQHCSPVENIVNEILTAAVHLLWWQVLLVQTFHGLIVDLQNFYPMQCIDDWRSLQSLFVFISFKVTNT